MPNCTQQELYCISKRRYPKNYLRDNINNTSVFIKGHGWPGSYTGMFSGSVEFCKNYFCRNGIIFSGQYFNWGYFEDFLNGIINW